MKRPALFLIFVLAIGATPAQAKCHMFKYWAFPFPQRCSVARQGQVRTILDKFGQMRVPEKLPNFGNGREKAAIQFPTDEPGIPLPSLAQADLDGGEADEPTRAKILLRAALEAPNAH